MAKTQIQSQEFRWRQANGMPFSRTTAINDAYVQQQNEARQQFNEIECK